MTRHVLDDVSAEMGNLLLSGWSMLNEVCKECTQVPLMSKAGVSRCLLCERTPLQVPESVSSNNEKIAFKENSQIIDLQPVQNEKEKDLDAQLSQLNGEISLMALKFLMRQWANFDPSEITSYQKLLDLYLPRFSSEQHKELVVFLNTKLLTYLNNYSSGNDMSTLIIITEALETLIKNITKTPSK